MGTWTPGPGATDGNDTFTGDVSNETADGLAGDDTLIGYFGDDTLIGGEGSDTLDGGGDVDMLDGGAGDDILIVRGQGPTLQPDVLPGEILGGGDGFDTLRTIGTVDLSVATISSIERLAPQAGQFFNDPAIVSIANSAAAFPSNLVIDGSGFGFDIIVYADEATRLIDLSGWTFINVPGRVHLQGTTGDDTLIGTSATDYLNGGPGADTMSGGAGNDFYFVDSIDDVVLETGPNVGFGDKVTSTLHTYSLPDNVEHLELLNPAYAGYGNAFDNEIVGNTSDNYIWGGDGDDNIDANDGDDILVGGAGADFLGGGGGVDLADYSDSDAGVSVDLTTGLGSGGHAAGDILQLIENVTGSAFADTLTGSDADNVLQGLDGDDILDGGAGADLLDGGAGDDTIFYDPADLAADVQGGAGVDTLVFTSGAAPTGFNLTAQGFERAEGRLADTGGADWSTRTLVYDSQWRLDTQTTEFDNGSWAFHDYDQTAQFAWSDEWTLRDAQNRVDVIVTTFDDGTYSNNNHDQDDSFVWSSEWTRYTAADEVDTIVTTFDDGMRSINEFDVAGAQPWVTQWTHYDALDRADIVVTTFDDASYSINELDVAGVQSWATQWTRYDALDRVDTVVTTFDDGTYAILDLDQEDAFDWASQWWLYNSSGQVVQYELIPDGAGLADQPLLMSQAAPIADPQHWPTYSWGGDWAFADHADARSADFYADAFVFAAAPRPLGPSHAADSALWDAMSAAHAGWRGGADAAAAVLPAPLFAADEAMEPFALAHFAFASHLAHDQLIMAA